LRSCNAGVRDFVIDILILDVPVGDDSGAELTMTSTVAHA